MISQYSNTNNPSSSLKRSLVLWFLLIALVPLSLNAWLGYRQTADGLTASAIQELETSAQMKIGFIQNWFDYRFMDLQNMAENQHNAEFLAALHMALQHSDQDVFEFTKSDAWDSLVNKHQNDLINFSRNYDYIYDVFLIDRDGNILFTVAGETDLGTNLYAGPYADTFFAKTTKRSWETGQLLFSDLELYSPSANQLTGFLTAPIYDDKNSKIGMFAIQIRMERINKLISGQNGKDSLTHYLVGKDGLLRTPLESEQINASGIVDQNVNTQHLESWNREQGVLGSEKSHGIISTYYNSSKQLVIGQSHTLKLPGVHWMLVSEISRDQSLVMAHNLGWTTLGIFLLAGLLVTVFAVYQARRITQPINKALDDLYQLRFAIDQHSIVAITDVQGTITYTNNKFTEISGYTREELMGQNHRLINSGYHPYEFFAEMFATITTGKAWHGEICNRAKDGHLYWVDTTIVPFIGVDGKPTNYISIRSDVSERKRIDLDLIAAKEVAEAATRQKSEFLANMSHEIRTPMNGVIGMTSLLLETQLTPKQFGYAKATKSSADALLVIINDILDFSKIEAGKLELENISFDLQLLAEDVAELMAIKCHEKDLEMLLRYKPGTPRFVVGDPGRVRQILLNLFSNAIKFTEQGHILLTVEATEVREDTVSFQIAIEDTGIGIAEDRVSQIFNKFDQEDNSTTRKYGGTGLGLAICQQLCHLMHGDITVKSKKGQGSTFCVNIRLDASKESPVGYSIENQAILHGLKVLIVDDNEIARTILLEQLSALQMRLVSATSAKVAIKIMQNAIADNDPFDILISDDQMPGMSGETLIKKISQQDLLTDGAMVLITSSPYKGQAASLKALGLDGYLTKPTYPSEVSQILTMIWDVKQQGKKDMQLITRNMLKETAVRRHDKPVFNDVQILLTEDNAINVLVATELLQGYGCSLTTAENGQEAVAAVKKQHFDLIFMDCQMPVMDGFEATAEIRALEDQQVIKQMPIVAFTANAMKSDEEKCLSAGMDDFITKPINYENLEKVMIKWLSQKMEMVSTDEPVELPQEEQSAPQDSESVQQDVDAEIFDLSVFNKLKQMFGDKFPTVIEKNIKNTMDNVARMEKAIQQKDLETLEGAAHSVKGTSAQFGAMQLSAAALEMEQLARDGDLEQASALLNDVRAAQERVAQIMQQQIS